MNGVVGLLLAGGQSRRMGGGDKCLRELAGRTLLDRAIERIAPQVDELILNANGDAQRFSDTGLPVVGDVLDGFAGPLAGVLTGMCWVRENRPAVRWVATFPTDAPFLPVDLVSRLLAAALAQGVSVACAVSAGRTHPPVALWDVGLADDLRTAMIDEGLRKIDVWTARHGIAHVDWPAEPFDPFFNANRPEDLAEAGRLIALSR